MENEDFITIPKSVWESVLDFWEEAMEERFVQAREWWGNRADEIIWSAYFPILKEMAHDGGLTEMNPKIICDNIVVNGEVVVKSEFRMGGEWEFYWKEYGGKWMSLCEDALVSAKDPEKNGEEYALMRF